jgi:hypothetical protein
MRLAWFTHTPPRPPLRYNCSYGIENFIPDVDVSRDDTSSNCHKIIRLHYNQISYQPSLLTAVLSS